MRYLLTGVIGLLTLSIFFACQKEISAEYGSAAKGSLQSAGGDCLPKTVNGTYAAGRALNDTNYIEVTVNVTAAGPYTVTTDTLNGYWFRATGTFANTGNTTVRLKGGGTPAAAQSDDFTVSFDSSDCMVTVDVTAGTGGGTGCNANVQGTYTAGTPTAAATNRITLSHTYATAGTFPVSTGTVNGYSFGPSSVTATAGTATAITLTATGTPVAAGTNTFTVNFGDGQTCTFTVTVASGTTPTNTDYFPTTQNSYWNYDDGSGADTFRTTVSGTATFSGTAYARFISADGGGPFDTSFYRKDAVTTGNPYFQSIDTAGLGPEIVLTQPRLNIMFLKNTLTTGATWTSDHSGTFVGFPGVLRFAFECIDGNATLTVNNKTYTNVYKVKQDVLLNIAGTGFQPSGIPTSFAYYAKGVGLILAEDDVPSPVQAVRTWVVN